jgi:hypothetical protein
MIIPFCFGKVWPPGSEAPKGDRSWINPRGCWRLEKPLAIDPQGVASEFFSFYKQTFSVWLDKRLEKNLSAG